MADDLGKIFAAAIRNIDWTAMPTRQPARSVGVRRTLLDRLGLSPVGGRVVFERGMSSGGYHETVFRLSRWVLCFTRDTKHWNGSRSYQISLRREQSTPTKDTNQ